MQTLSHLCTCVLFRFIMMQTGCYIDLMKFRDSSFSKNICRFHEIYMQILWNVSYFADLHNAFFCISIWLDSHIMISIPIYLSTYLSIYLISISICLSVCVHVNLFISNYPWDSSGDASRPVCVNWPVNLTYPSDDSRLKCFKSVWGTAVKEKHS